MGFFFYKVQVSTVHSTYIIVYIHIQYCYILVFCNAQSPLCMYCLYAYIHIYTYTADATLLQILNHPQVVQQIWKKGCRNASRVKTRDMLHTWMRHVTFKIPAHAAAFNLLWFQRLIVIKQLSEYHYLQRWLPCHLECILASSSDASADNQLLLLTQIPGLACASALKRGSVSFNFNLQSQSC